MTAYNREKYIAEAIESVLASTYQDFELIIVDDCSKDKTVEIARKYEVQDSRVRVYVNEENLGDYPNRNKAASYAKGKYLKYIDSDDSIYPHGLEILVNGMEKFETCLLGICSLPMSLESQYPILATSFKSNELHFVHGIGVFSFGPLSAIIRADYFKRVGGFSLERMVSDSKFWLKASLEGDLLLFQDGIIWNRIHPGQELRNVKDFFLSYKKIEKDHLGKLRIIFPILYSKALKRKNNYLLRILFTNILRFKLSSAFEVFKELLFFNFK
jgi:glycosyltransferase involved in cell wall biosynthesis